MLNLLFHQMQYSLSFYFRLINNYIAETGRLPLRKGFSRGEAPARAGDEGSRIAAHVPDKSKFKGLAEFYQMAKKFCDFFKKLPQKWH